MFLKRLRKSSFRKRWKDEEKPTTDNDVCGTCDTDMADLCVCDSSDEIENEEEKSN